jgi:hypothetical protein
VLAADVPRGVEEREPDPHRDLEHARALAARDLEPAGIGLVFALDRRGSGHAADKLDRHAAQVLVAS